LEDDVQFRDNALSCGKAELAALLATKAETIYVRRLDSAIAIAQARDEDAHALVTCTFQADDGTGLSCGFALPADWVKAVQAGMGTNDVAKFVCDQTGAIVRVYLYAIDSSLRGTFVPPMGAIADDCLESLATFTPADPDQDDRYCISARVAALVLKIARASGLRFFYQSEESAGFASFGSGSWEVHASAVSSTLDTEADPL
jgi:hypothetical protein